LFFCETEHWGFMGVLWSIVWQPPPCVCVCVFVCVYLSVCVCVCCVFVCVFVYVFVTFFGGVMCSSEESRR